MSFRWDLGDAVRVTTNVRNDGTYAGAVRGDLLVRRGSVGTVIDVGLFLQSQVIYTVHFLDDDRVVGCREGELLGADECWIPGRFESRERVRAGKTLSAAGSDLRIVRGDAGEVLRVVRDVPGGIVYHVHFDGAPGRTLAVPESALVSYLE